VFDCFFLWGNPEQDTTRTHSHADMTLFAFFLGLARVPRTLWLFFAAWQRYLCFESTIQHDKKNKLTCSGAKGLKTSALTLRTKPPESEAKTKKLTYKQARKQTKTRANKQTMRPMDTWDMSVERHQHLWFPDLNPTWVLSQSLLSGVSLKHQNHRVFFVLQFQWKIKNR
jgi:hypothetical protein